MSDCGVKARQYGSAMSHTMLLRDSLECVAHIHRHSLGIAWVSQVRCGEQGARKAQVWFLFALKFAPKSGSCSPAVGYLAAYTPSEKNRCAPRHVVPHHGAVLLNNVLNVDFAGLWVKDEVV